MRQGSRSSSIRENSVSRSASRARHLGIQIKVHALLRIASDTIQKITPDTQAPRSSVNLTPDPWGGAVGRICGAGHATKAGANTSGAGGLYPIDPCGR
jgi:hypothetical protein